MPDELCGESADFMAMLSEELVGQVERGELKVQVGKVFGLDEIVAAHRVMEGNAAGGKIVVVV